jgi:ABC-2 type transport system ATP-binding protein
MTIIEVRNLEKSFGSRQAVKGVSFTVQKGEVLGVLGPNGAGKSTTLSLISGLLKPRAGAVRVGDWDMTAQPLKAKAELGIVPQEPAIYQELTARQNLKFFGEMNGVTGKELEQAVDRTLAVVGLTDRADDRSGKFSGGMKRRLNIAAGLLHSPKVMIMDEPTVGVDPQSRRHILDTVKSLKEAGTTILYTSHYVEEVEELCDRVLIMDHGEIIASGTIPELLTQAGQYQEISITLAADSEDTFEHVRAIPSVKEIFVTGRTLRILAVSAEEVLPLVFEELVKRHQISEIRFSKPNLESLFLKLTGRALRDS